MRRVLLYLVDSRWEGCYINSLFWKNKLSQLWLTRPNWLTGSSTWRETREEGTSLRSHEKSKDVPMSRTGEWCERTGSDSSLTTACPAPLYTKWCSTSPCPLTASCLLQWRGHWWSKGRAHLYPKPWQKNFWPPCTICFHRNNQDSGKALPRSVFIWLSGVSLGKATALFLIGDFPF